MDTQDQSVRPQLAIDINSDLRYRLEMEAGQHNISLREYATYTSNQISSSVYVSSNV